MVLIRLVEEASAQLYQQGKIGGFLHLYIGQEAVSTGLISARKPQDRVITAYRDHGVAINCGLPADQGSVKPTDSAISATGRSVSTSCCDALSVRSCAISFDRVVPISRRSRDSRRRSWPHIFAARSAVKSLSCKCGRKAVRSESRSDRGIPLDDSSLSRELKCDFSNRLNSHCEGKLIFTPDRSPLATR